LENFNIFNCLNIRSAGQVNKAINKKGYLL